MRELEALQTVFNDWYSAIPKEMDIIETMNRETRYRLFFKSGDSVWSGNMVKCDNTSHVGHDARSVLFLNLPKIAYYDISFDTGEQEKTDKSFMQWISSHPVASRYGPFDHCWYIRTLDGTNMYFFESIAGDYILEMVFRYRLRETRDDSDADDNGDNADDADDGRKESDAVLEEEF
jgi:hypothetical protein